MYTCSIHGTDSKNSDKQDFLVWLVLLLLHWLQREEASNCITVETYIKSKHKTCTDTTAGCFYHCVCFYGKNWRFSQSDIWFPCGPRDYLLAGCLCEEVRATDPLFVLHMRPQQLPRPFFFSFSSSFCPCPQLKLSTRLPIAILNKSYWLHSCLMTCMRLVQHKCTAGSRHSTGDSRPVHCELSENPSPNGKPLPALSYLFSIHFWHSIYHSLIQRKTSTSKAPHPFRELTFRA